LNFIPSIYISLIISLPTRHSSDLATNSPFATPKDPGPITPLAMASWIAFGHTTSSVLYRLPEPSMLSNPRLRLSPLPDAAGASRSEEHTSELQSRFELVCRLLLEK